jgi:hypothetical protein
LTEANSYLKGVSEFDGGHRFLAEELLVPMVNKTDVTRTSMFVAHSSQAVVLEYPERPRVFSRFENKIGSYTTAVRISGQGGKIIGIFEKNALQRVYAIEYADGSAGIHFGAPVRHLTENYGYLLDNSKMDGLMKGSEILPDSIMQSWPCHDDGGNFMFGINLKTVYMNLEGLTYEDGLVISESAAQRLAHTSIDQILVNMNANDLSPNLYGDESEEGYQGFPEVGEDVKNGMLLARRRINHESILYDLSASQLSRFNPESDVPFYSDGGMVVDVDIFSNLSEAELDRHPFNRQLLAHHRKWLEFQSWVMDIFSPYVTGGEEDGERKYSSDVAFWFKKCRNSLAGKWRNERKEFDGVILRFTIAKSNPAVEGSKLTNRYGGKGVVSQIWPDDRMPITEDGRHADIVVNSLGVVNRLNPSQLYESELNFIADAVQRMVASDCSEDPENGWRAGWERVQKFLSIVSPVYAAWMAENLGEEDIKEAVSEIAGGIPIYIHEPPYFGSIEPEGLEAAYTAFGVERIKFKGIEERMILGTNYYMKLKHEPKGKHSARSAKYLGVNGVPAKSSKALRGGTEHHSSTPIRLGEQEVQGLMVANSPDALKRLLRLYAVDDVSRAGLIAELALNPNPFSMARHEPTGDGITRPVAGLKAFLESIGQELVTVEKPEDRKDDDEI